MDVGVSGLLAGVGSTVGSIFNASANRKFQQRENQKNRDFNAAQAALSRQYNSQMINQQNAYNSPSAVMDRLRKAGLNPNLAYGDIGSGAQVSVGSTSQSASSNGSVSPSNVDFSGLMQGLLVDSQIKLNEAQANKLNSDTDLNKVELEVQKQMAAGRVTLQGLDIQAQSFQNYKTDAEIREIYLAGDKLEQETKKVEQDILNSKIEYDVLHETWVDLINHNQAMIESDAWREQVKGFMAQWKVDQYTAETYLKTAFSIITLNNSKSKESSANTEVLKKMKDNTEKEGYILDLQKDKLTIEVANDSTLSRTERIMNMVGSAVGTFVGSGVGALVGVRTGKQIFTKPKQVGFVTSGSKR